ncbi:hypothetical protein Hte_000505 [Hypoxylon texense]
MARCTGLGCGLFRRNRPITPSIDDDDDDAISFQILPVARDGNQAGLSVQPAESEENAAEGSTTPDGNLQQANRRAGPVAIDKGWDLSTRENPQQATSMQISQASNRRRAPVPEELQFYMIPAQPRAARNSEATQKAYLSSIRGLSLQDAPLRQRAGQSSTPSSVSSMTPNTANFPTFPVSPLTPGFPNQQTPPPLNQQTSPPIPSGTPRSSGPPGGSAGTRRQPPRARRRGRARVANNIPSRLPAVAESRMSWLNSEQQPIQIPSDTNANWAIALQETTVQEEEAISVVTGLVRRAVDGEAEASDVVRALLSEDYAKIVDAYAGEDFTIDEKKIQSVRIMIRDQKRTGAWKGTKRLLNGYLQDAKNRKALTLLERWKAAEEATEETKTKGKQKEETINAQPNGYTQHV